MTYRRYTPEVGQTVTPDEINAKLASANTAPRWSYTDQPTTEKYLAFDLEISKVIPGGQTDWMRYRPFGISCAVTIAECETKPRMWYSMSPGHYSVEEKMSVVDAQQLVRYLDAMRDDGYTIVTFNGSGFDFDVLAEESGLVKECACLNKSHVDIFFQIFCMLGYAPGLNRLAVGMGLPGKPADMDGAKAPQLWLAGEYKKVMSYCTQDVRMTLNIIKKANELGCLQWTSKTGKPVALDIKRWLTVQEAAKLSKPDTSWMTGEIWEREKFTGWMSRN